MTLGERVHLHRRRKQLTQQQLGDEVGLSKASVYRIEKGEFDDVKGQTVVRLAQVLGVSADYLLGMTEDQRPVRVGAADGP
jgi:transcriptional regulator with XRE-family HTH domain